MSRLSSSDKKSRPTAPAVDSAISVLELLVRTPYALNLSEISKAVDISVASCYRILNSLLKKQMVTADSVRKKSYRIGPNIFQMASAFYNHQSIIPYFHPIAEILKNETRQMVLLSVPVGNKVVLVAKTEYNPQWHLNAYIGQTLSLHETATGKAILSAHQPAYWQDYMQAEIAEESSRELLHMRLKRAQKLGYAITPLPDAPRTSSIAAPVLNLRNEPVASISLCVPVPPEQDQELRQYSAPLIQAARQITARIA